MRPLTDRHGEWIAPTITTDRVIVAPDPYPCIEADTLTVETNADGEVCGVRADFDARASCPLIEGHVGPHWLAMREVVDQSAPIRVWAHIYEVDQ